MKKKVFIDGSFGTTGLRIFDRLSSREDIELLTLDRGKHKEPLFRAQLLAEADVAFLCLPDDAARSTVELAGDADTVIIDASTAHRTFPGWVYGFPELDDSFRSEIGTSKRIAVPGCHAGGFIALVYPLVKAGILGADDNLSCFSLTGYSGGGKKMIGEYEAEGRDELFDAPRVYGIGQMHKHTKEMTVIPSLSKPPVFLPTVASFYCGMEVCVPIHASQLNGATKQDIEKLYKEKYNGIVYYTEGNDECGYMSAAKLKGKDSMEISVQGNDERFTLVARFDNLGKGASGAAVQCMNIVLGIDEKTGLNL